MKPSLLFHPDKFAGIVATTIRLVEDGGFHVLWEFLVFKFFPFFLNNPILFSNFVQNKERTKRIGLSHGTNRED